MSMNGFYRLQRPERAVKHMFMHTYTHTLKLDSCQNELSSSKLVHRCSVSADLFLSPLRNMFLSCWCPCSCETYYIVTVCSNTCTAGTNEFNMCLADFLVMFIRKADRRSNKPLHNSQLWITLCINHCLPVMLCNSSVPSLWPKRHTFRQEDAIFAQKRVWCVTV